MSNAEDKPRPNLDGAIQLEPVTSREKVEAVDSAKTRCAQAREPVPARPLPLCPNCDYNLTGLIERRCPECGEPFDLGDARFRGFELSEGGASLRRWEMLDWVKRGLGVGLIILGFCVPTIIDAVFKPAPGVISAAAKKWLMMLLVAPGDLMLLMVCWYLDYGWARILLTAGALTVAAGLLVTFL